MVPGKPKILPSRVFGLSGANEKHHHPKAIATKLKSMGDLSDVSRVRTIDPSWSAEAMEAAMDAIDNGMSVSEAAAAFNIPPGKPCTDSSGVSILVHYTPKGRGSQLNI